MTINKAAINDFHYADMSISILLFLLIYNFNMTTTILIFVYFGLAMYTLATQKDVVETFSRKDIFYGTTIFLIVYQIVQAPISFFWMILVLIFVGSLKYLFDEYGYPLDHIKKKINSEKIMNDFRHKKENTKKKLEEKGLTTENIQEKMDVFNENKKD